jgi:transposase InsO family protein
LAGLNRLSHVDRATGEPIRRYEHPDPGSLYAFVHTVIDDHSRVAYAEIHDDETASTATGVLSRTIRWLADRGVTVERVLSDNGSAYRSHLWRDICEALAIKPKRTRPYRPQTNGKSERFHRTMADGWAYARCYRSEHEHREALAAWCQQVTLTGWPTSVEGLVRMLPWMPNVGWQT